MEKDTNNIIVAIGGLFGGGGFLLYILLTPSIQKGKE